MVHDHRDMGITFDGRLDKVLQKRLAGVFARPGARLHDHGGAHLVGRLHDGLNLLEVVDVKCWNTVAVGGCVVQQFAH